MLRQGRFFADACYYYGQDVPGSAYFFSPAGNLDERKKMLPVLPKGYDYDVCDHTTFATMFVEDGFVGLPSGMRYKYLVLPDHARYTPDALEKVAELVKAGATVIGRKPVALPVARRLRECRCSDSEHGRRTVAGRQRRTPRRQG